MYSFAPCAGIIVFDNDQTVLVATPQGHLSFPKGKRNRGETNLETAWRELGEETGLTTEHVTLIDDFHIDEQSNRGNVNIRYFIGYLTNPLPNFTFDKEELASVSWYNVNIALVADKLKDSRKEVLRMAYEKYQSILNSH